MFGKIPSGIYFSMLVILLLVVAGCQPLPSPAPQSLVPPENASAPSDATPVSSASLAGVAAAPTPTPIPVAVAPTPTLMPVVNEEEDCMAACHIPDPSETFAAGAKPQPVSHVEHTTCLTCHSTMTQPALPASHAGRMDPACALCHTPPPAK